MASGFEHWDEETTLTWQRDEFPKPAEPRLGAHASPPTLRGVGPRGLRVVAKPSMPAALKNTAVWDAVAYWDSTERKTETEGMSVAFEAANLSFDDDDEGSPSDPGSDPGDSDPGADVGETASRGLWWTGITLVMVMLLAISVGNTIAGA